MELKLNSEYPIRAPCQLRVSLRPFFGPGEKKDKWVYCKMPRSEIFLFPSEITENMVVYLAGFLTPLFGWKMVRLQETFPDATYKDLSTDATVKVEFEKDARDFLIHSHPPSGCDVILCWEDTLDEQEKTEKLFSKNPSLKIVELKKVFFHYDFELSWP